MNAREPFLFLLQVVAQSPVIPIYRQIHPENGIRYLLAHARRGPPIGVVILVINVILKALPLCRFRRQEFSTISPDRVIDHAGVGKE